MSVVIRGNDSTDTILHPGIHNHFLTDYLNMLQIWACSLQQFETEHIGNILKFHNNVKQRRMHLIWMRQANKPAFLKLPFRCLFYGDIYVVHIWVRRGPCVRAGSSRHEKVFWARGRWLTHFDNRNNNYDSAIAASHVYSPRAILHIFSISKVHNGNYESYRSHPWHI